jgi:hypothetical protein
VLVVSAALMGSTLQTAVNAISIRQNSSVTTRFLVAVFIGWLI